MDDRDETPGTHPCPRQVTPRRSGRRHQPRVHRWIEAKLGIGRTATSYEVKRAFLELRRTFEPARLLTPKTVDLYDDVALILEVIEEAFEILRESDRRERYRRAIEAGPPG